MSNPNVYPRFLKAGTEAISVYPRFLWDGSGGETQPPDLTPPDIPAGLDAFLDLAKPSNIVIELLAPSVPMNMNILESPLSDTAPRLPLGLYIVDEDPAPGMPAKVLYDEVPDAPLPEAPAGFGVEELPVTDLSPTIPLGIIVVDTDPVPASPTLMLADDSVGISADAPVTPRGIGVVESPAPESAPVPPVGLDVTEEDPTPRVPSLISGSDTAAIAVPVDFEVELV